MRTSNGLKSAQDTKPARHHDKYRGISHVGGNPKAQEPHISYKKELVD